MSTGWIGVDLDGTLAFYEGWTHELHIGEPIYPMLERVKRWRTDGHEVRIFTARAGPYPGRDLAPVIKAIEDWCLHHLGEVLPITCQKDYGMMELWDDRAVQVVPNVGYPIGYSTRGLA